MVAYFVSSLRFSMFSLNKTKIGNSMLISTSLTGTSQKLESPKITDVGNRKPLML